ncbi:hypothetical protein V8E54_001731 [Elaphomyces granulatus]
MASPTDIITYVGIPLAVIGTVPILYTCTRAVLTLRSIRRALSHNWLLDSAVLRANLMLGLVEVELPRCTITPLDRGLDSEYWKLNPHHSSIRGGTWSTFYWNNMVTGRKLYRVQYKDELRIPQAEIDFEELVAFLLDRGAVPDAKGWNMLKTSGLWTPTGTALLLPPAGFHGAALKVALPDDSDGILSLKVDWQSEWNGRNSASLPPFWMRLKQPGSNLASAHGNVSSSADSQDYASSIVKGGLVHDKLLEIEGSNADEKDSTDSPAQDANLEGLQQSDEGETQGQLPTPTLLQVIEEKRVLLHGKELPSDSVRFCISGAYIQRVFFEDQGMPAGKHQELWNSEDGSSLWFVCIASALSHSCESGIWNFSIPRDIMLFVKKSVIPCGIMVMLDILEEKDVPPWASPPPKMGVDMEARHRRFLDSQRQRTIEAHMPPAQAEAARRARELQEARSNHDEFMESIKKRREYEERRELEALNSQRLENKSVAQANLTYLAKTKVIPTEYSTEDLAQAVLYLMILDKEQAKAIVEMLDQWLSWSQAGGLNRSQWNFLKENRLSFCYASSLISVIEMVGSLTTQASIDMFECMKLWKKVRLG